MKTEPNPYLLNALLEVVDNQIRDNNPPDTKRTLERLIQAGHSRDKARRLIAAVVQVEVFEVLKEHRLFDEARFRQALDRLPELPE